MRAARLVFVTLSGRDPSDLAHEVRERHLAALRRAGLVPVAVAGSASAEEVAAVLDVCVAVYLPGTDFVPSWLSGDGPRAALAAREAGLAWDPWKVRADHLVVAEAWRRRLPLLGVCGGMQAMVALAGGTLRTGTPEELRAHASVAERVSVVVDPGGLAASIFGGTLPVNSFHRQVVDRMPPSELVVSVRADDGVVEAVEAPRAVHPFWLGVQWHPELLGDDRPFAALAAAAGVAGAVPSEACATLRGQCSPPD